MSSKDKGKQSSYDDGRYARILDAIDANIAVLNQEGTILITNKGWSDFAASNPSSDGSLPQHVGLGANYLSACATASGPSSDGAMAVYEGIRGVLDGRRNTFCYEYPCHSPNKQRWFLLKVKALPRSKPCEAVVAHIDITDRYLAEIAAHTRQNELNVALQQLQEMAGKIKLSLCGERLPVSPSALSSARDSQSQTDLLGRLSKREMDVLSGLVRGERNSAIAARLKLSAKSVSTYRARIFLKLKVDSTAQLVALISRSGALN